MGAPRLPTNVEKENTYIADYVKGVQSIRQTIAAIEWLAQRMDTIAVIYALKKGVANTHGKDIKELTQTIKEKKSELNNELNLLKVGLTNVRVVATIDNVHYSPTAQAESTTSHYAESIKKILDDLIKSLSKKLEKVANKEEKLNKIKLKISDHHYYRLLIMTIIQASSLVDKKSSVIVELSKLFDSESIKAIQKLYSNLGKTIDLSPPEAVVKTSDKNKTEDIRNQALALCKDEKNIGYCPAIQTVLSTNTDKAVEDTSWHFTNKVDNDTRSSSTSLSESRSSFFTVSSASSIASSRRSSSSYNSLVDSDSEEDPKPASTRQHVSTLPPPIFIPFGAGAKLRDIFPKTLTRHELSDNDRLKNLKEHVDTLLNTEQFVEAEAIIRVINDIPKDTKSDIDTTIKKIVIALETLEKNNQISKKATDLIGPPAIPLIRP